MIAVAVLFVLLVTHFSGRSDEVSAGWRVAESPLALTISDVLDWIQGKRFTTLEECPISDLS